MSTIQINLIRSPHGNGDDDDVLTISKTGEKQYSLTYTDKTATSVLPRSIQLDRDDVFDHLETTFDMLDIDIAPFKQIQILAPTFPSTLLTVSSLRMDEIRETVFRAVENTMNNWPTASTIEYLRRSPRLAGRI
jgi:hypothetical protein